MRITHPQRESFKLRLRLLLHGDLSAATSVPLLTGRQGTSRDDAGDNPAVSAHSAETMGTRGPLTSNILSEIQVLPVSFQLRRYASTGLLSAFLQMQFYVQGHHESVPTAQETAVTMHMVSVQVSGVDMCARSQRTTGKLQRDAWSPVPVGRGCG